MEENSVMADSGGLESLARLEERILETVEQLRASRREKAELEKAAALLRERLAQSEQRAKELAAEVESSRVERRQIGARVQKLLAQIDLLSQG
jgi:chromosome segregation ATPase